MSTGGRNDSVWKDEPALVDAAADTESRRQGEREALQRFSSRGVVALGRRGRAGAGAVPGQSHLTAGDGVTVGVGVGVGVGVVPPLTAFSRYLMAAASDGFTTSSTYTWTNAARAATPM